MAQRHGTRHRTTAKRREIQGLRAVAVALVVADHFFGTPSGGFVGVDVFFVISGFLITGILVRGQMRDGTVSFSGFYRARIRRIVPAAAVTLLVTVVAAYLVFNKGRFTTTLTDALWSALFAANWRFAISGTDYFAAAGPQSPFQHFWSLAVEEQFYIVWPIVILLAGLLSAGPARAWDEPSRARARRFSFIAIAVLSCLSFGYALWETATNPTFAYFSTFSRAWELGVGALLALALRNGAQLVGWLRIMLAWLGMAGIAVSAVTISMQSAFPAPWAALPVLSSACILLAGTGPGRLFAWPLTNPVSVYVGDISYSLYLWHFPVLIVGGPALAHLLGGDSSPVYGVVLVATAVGLAALSYHFIEEPIRRSNWLQPRHLRAGSLRIAHFGLAAVAAVTAVVVSLALVADHSSIAQAARPDALPTVTVSEGAAAGEQPQQAALTAEIEKALTATEWPADLHPTLDTVAAEELPGNTAQCGGPLLPQDANTCTFGDPNAPKTAVLVGDSIAQAYVPALAQIYGTGEWKLRITSMYACPFIDADVGDSDGRIELCQTRKQREVEIVNELAPDLVIVGNTYWRATDKATGQKVTLDVWNAAFDRQLAKITSAAKAVLAISPPAPDKDITACMTAFSTPADCVSNVSSTDWADMANGQKTSIDKIGGTFVDTRLWYCDDKGQCPALVGSVLMKKDAAHITADYARYITPVVQEALVAAGVR